MYAADLAPTVATGPEAAGESLANEGGRTEGAKRNWRFARLLALVDGDDGGVFNVSIANLDTIYWGLRANLDPVA